jgi:FMN-dependent NADH-azoreductase
MCSPRVAGAPLDTRTPYLRTILTFMGISDVEFVVAEGPAVSEPSRE